MAHQCESPSPLLSPAFQLPAMPISTSDHSAMKTMPTRWAGSGASLIRFCESRLIGLP
jgi:hypothetical protein